MHQGKGLRFKGTLPASCCASLIIPSLGFISYVQRERNGPQSSPSPSHSCLSLDWLGLLGLITLLVACTRLCFWGFCLVSLSLGKVPCGNHWVQKSTSYLNAKDSSGPSPGGHTHSWRAVGSERLQEGGESL